MKISCTTPAYMIGVTGVEVALTQGDKLTIKLLNPTGEFVIQMSINEASNMTSLIESLVQLSNGVIT